MKKISVLLILSILCTSLLGVTAFGFEFSTLTLKDTNDHWAQDPIDTLKALGVLNGYDGYSKPDDIITRGEFTALITRAFEIKPNGYKKQFTDIGDGHIFYENIMAASDAGIIDGFPDNTFRAENMITREEIMLIISRLTPPSDSFEPSFSDIRSDYTYRAQLGKVCADGIINGYPDKTFRPYEKTTRAQAASMVLAAMKKYLASESGETVINNAGEYITKHFSGIFENCIGSALSDSQYIIHTLNKAKELGYTVSNNVSDIGYKSISQDGPFSTVEAQYYVTRSLNGAQKRYRGSSILKLLSINGQTRIYEHTTNIIEEVKINLTWEIYSSVTNVNTPGVNVVSPTCFTVTEEPKAGETVTPLTSDSSYPLYFNSSLKNAYVNYAKAMGYKIWAMYKTDYKTETANALFTNHTARQNAANLLIEKILNYDLDGINFDFENMYHTDHGSYTNHVREIAIIAHTLGAAVSADVSIYYPTSLTWSMCYDRDALAKYADYIALMAYDQFSKGGTIAGPVAGLNWTKSSIERTLMEVPSSKLLLGMPYYIRVWQLKNGKKISSEAVSMAKANEYASKDGVTIEYDNKYFLNKVTWSSDEYDYVFWMENAETIRQRVILANEYSLAGVASWRRGFETEDVWNVIAEELYKY